MRRIVFAILGAGALSALGGAGCGPNPDPPITEDNCTGEVGSICTWAGTGAAALSDLGTFRAGATLYNPIEIEFGADGTAYIADWNNHRVVRVVDDLLDIVMGAELPGDGPEDRSDLTEPGAPGDSIGLNHPTDIAVDPTDGRVYSTNWHNHKIRRYDPATGLVYVLCGRAPGYAGNGTTLDAATRLRFPHSLAFADDGTLYFVDAGNDRIRRILPDGTIEDFAGDSMQGFVDGVDRMAARFSFPLGTLLDAEPGGALTVGPDGNVYVADFQNHRIRKIDLATGMVTTIAGSYTPPADLTMLPPPEGAFSGDGGDALAAELNFPRDLAFGPDGNLYFADSLNHRIRMIDMTSGIITTVAGNGEAAFAGDTGLAIDASLDTPTGIAFGPDGNLYIADYWNHRIRMVEL